MRQIPLLVVALLQATGAHALESETVTATAGKEVRLGYYSLFRNDCTAGPAPEVKLTKEPKGGAIIIRAGVLTTTRVPNCPKLSGAVRSVFYRPNEGFSGRDDVAFDVINPATGAAAQHRVVITVEPPTTKL